MRSQIAFFLACCVALCGCSVSRTSTERRVAELPRGRPETTLATAEKICRDLIAAGYGADIQRKFPSLTPQQLQGLYLNWNEGVFSQTGKSVFITCGITYTGALSEAKAVADYCESVVKNAVAARFAPARPVKVRVFGATRTADDFVLFEPSLARALSRAAPTILSDLKKVHIYRYDKSGMREDRVVDASRVLEPGAPDVVLEDEDWIFVPEKII